MKSSIRILILILNISMITIASSTLLVDQIKKSHLNSHPITNVSSQGNKILQKQLNLKNQLIIQFVKSNVDLEDSDDDRFKEQGDRCNSTKQSIILGEGSRQHSNTVAKKDQKVQNNKEPEEKLFTKEQVISLFNKKNKDLQEAKLQNFELTRRIQQLHIKFSRQYAELYASEIESLQIQLALLKEESKMDRDQFSSMESGLKKQVMRNEKNYKKIIEKLEEQVKRKSKQMNQEIMKKTQDFNKIHKENQIIIKKTQQLELKMKDMAQAKLEMEAQIKAEIKEKEQLLKNISTLKQEKAQILSSKQKLQAQVQATKKKIESLESHLKAQTVRIVKITNDNKILTNQISDLTAKRQQDFKKIDLLQKELSQQKTENRNLFKFKKMTTNGLHLINELFQSRPLSLENISQDSFIEIQRSIQSLKYFPDSTILSKSKSIKKEFLVQALKEFIQCPSFKTQLIYRHDSLNPTNFHSYIDKKENLLIIIQLANGTILGGFTVFPFDIERTQKPGKGLLISITDQKVYRQRADPKQPIASYDRYFYILGNAQLRIRFQEDKLFSNFGIANSTFDHRGDSRAGFLKTLENNKNELELITFQFYQIKPNQL